MLQHNLFAKIERFRSLKEHYVNVDPKRDNNFEK
jgi:hypothetical protein